MARRTSKLVSLPFNRYGSDNGDYTPSGGYQAEDTAGPLDYLIIREVLAIVLDQAPRLGFGVMAPMLLALDRDAGTILTRRPKDSGENIFIEERRRACREVTISTWLLLAERYNLTSLEASLRGVSMVQTKPNVLSQSCPNHVLR
jgi:hypothetical protein